MGEYIYYTYLIIIWNKETVVEIHGWSYHFTTPCVSPIGVGRDGNNYLSILCCDVYSYNLLFRTA